MVLDAENVCGVGLKIHILKNSRGNGWCYASTGLVHVGRERRVHKHWLLAGLGFSSLAAAHAQPTAADWPWGGLEKGWSF